jgi:peptide/nickel transport system permease protein
VERGQHCGDVVRAGDAVTRLLHRAETTNVQGFASFIARRAAASAALVVAVSSAAMLLARIAPGNQLSAFDTDPAVAAAECARTRCGDPLVMQYVAWVGRAVRLDLGESTRFGRPVSGLIGERAANSFVLGMCALVLATIIGIPAGIFTGSRRQGLAARAAGAASIVMLSVPPLISSLGLLLIASATGWFPVGGTAPPEASLFEHARYLVLPVIALALPMAATLERLQSQAIAEALREPCVRAAAARGIGPGRLIWRHAWKLSLKPVLAIYGIVVGAVISGSFVVELVVAWPGLGALMYDALVARDAYLVAGCAAAGAIALAAGILASDVALAAVDPRTTEHV